MEEAEELEEGQGLVSMDDAVEQQEQQAPLEAPLEVALDAPLEDAPLEAPLEAALKAPLEGRLVRQVEALFGDHLGVQEEVGTPCLRDALGW